MMNQFKTMVNTSIQMNKDTYVPVPPILDPVFLGARLEDWEEVKSNVDCFDPCLKLGLRLACLLDIDQSSLDYAHACIKHVFLSYTD